MAAILYARNAEQLARKIEDLIGMVIDTEELEVALQCGDAGDISAAIDELAMTGRYDFRYEPDGEIHTLAYECQRCENIGIHCKCEANAVAPKKYREFEIVDVLPEGKARKLSLSDETLSDEYEYFEVAEPMAYGNTVYNNYCIKKGA